MSRIPRELFYPKSIAIFGPSEKRGYYWIYSLIDSGYNGAIFPIHPTKVSGGGFPFYKTLLEVPQPVDYAIIAIPAKYVLEAMEQCARKKVKHVHIFTSGFSEIGPEGKEREEAILRVARENNILITGPNCMGIYCPASGLSFRSDLFQYDRGEISFISQSGGIANNIVLRGHKVSLRFSKVISVGNSIDLSIADYLEFLMEDPETSVIGLYIENVGKSVEEGRRLFKTLRAANRKKPVVVWRGGRTALGAVAASSHTGAIASNDKIWNAVVKQTGIIGVRTFEELVDILISFQTATQEYLPKGPNIGLMSISGGVGVTNADLLFEMGLNVPQLSQATTESILQDPAINNVGFSAKNPMDLGISYLNLDVFERIVNHLVADPIIDCLILEISNHYFYGRILLEKKDFNRIFVTRIKEIIRNTYRHGSKKPIALVMPTIAYEQERLVDRDFFIKNNIPVADTVECAGRAIRYLLNYSNFLKTLPLREKIV